MCSLGNFGFGSSAWNYRLGSLLWKLLLALKTSCLEPFAGKLSLGIVRLGFVVWDRSDGIVRLGLAFAMSPLRFCAWELPFKIVRFESVDWKLSLGIFRLGTFAR